MLAAAAPAWADLDSVEEIIVTGTRASGVTAATSTAPVDVVSGERLAGSGVADLGQALQTALPSINFPQVTIGSAAGANLNATLRGLAPDQSLVLVNGRRQHKSAFVNVKGGASRGTQAVDLATLPLSAIARVEVLRDAAAAQYGSDAIAGVINVVLREASDGGAITLRSGYYPKEGDGFSNYLRAWKGFSLPGDGFLTVALDAGQANDTDQFIGPETRQYYFPGDPREATTDKSRFYRGQPEIRSDVRLGANAETSLSDQLTLQAFATAARKNTRINGNPLLPRANETLRDFYPDGVRPNQWVFSRDRTLGTSLVYDAGDKGDVDLSLTWGDNRQRYKTTSSHNASLGLASPTEFRTGSLYNRQIEGALDYVVPISFGALAEPLIFSAGISAREELYRIGAGEPNSYRDGGVPILDGPNKGRPAPFGSMTWQAYLPEDAGSLSRNVYGAYASIEGHLTDKLQFSLTGRAEDYSDFGGVQTGEFSARYDFTPNFALRGSVSTGVRAPSVGQVAYSYTQTTTVPNQTGLFQIRTFPVDQPVAIALGGTDLKPEKSVNISGGAVFRWARGSLIVDAYRVEIDDRIALSDNFTGPAVEALLRAAGYPQAVGANFFTNALDTKTTGVSVTGQQAFDLGDYGSLDLNLGIEVNKTEVTTIRSVNGRIPVGRQVAGYLEDGNPDKKIILGANWLRGPFAATVTGIYYGEYTQRDATKPELDQTFSPQTVVNLSVSYDVSEKVKLSLGADNLFNSKPDIINDWYRDGGLPTSSLNPVSWDGTFAWASVTYNF